jgi:hypothetical protein
MKYLNKKKVERSSWPTAKPPKIHHRHDAKIWCQQQPGDKRFYFHYTNTRWWFEDEADALAFSLVWSGR